MSLQHWVFFNVYLLFFSNLALADLKIERRDNGGILARLCWLHSVKDFTKVIIVLDNFIYKYNLGGITLPNK